MCMSDNSVIAVVFCVVSAVRTFDSRLVINEIPIKWRPVCVEKKLRQAVMENHVFNIYVSPTVTASINELYTRCEGQLHSLE